MQGEVAPEAGRVVRATCAVVEGIVVRVFVHAMAHVRGTIAQWEKPGLIVPYVGNDGT